MKAHFTSTQRSLYAESAIPQWITDMGLEWLYLMLSPSSDLNGTARS
jgi:hypothetical protein